MDSLVGMIEFQGFIMEASATGENILGHIIMSAHLGLFFPMLQLGTMVLMFLSDDWKKIKLWFPIYQQMLASSVHVLETAIFRTISGLKLN